MNWSEVLRFNADQEQFLTLSSQHSAYWEQENSIRAELDVIPDLAESLSAGNPIKLVANNDLPFDLLDLLGGVPMSLFISR